MANILIINRIEEGLFTHTLTAEGETQTAIDNAPNLTSFWINGVRVMDFKTKNGAPLVRNQRILPSEITITDSFGSTPPQTGFTNDVQVWNALGALGYFQGFSGGSGGGGVDSFINLTDVNPNLYLGFEGMVYVVNETETGLEPVIFYNYNNLTQLDDVEIDSLVPSDTGKYVAVSMVDGEPKFTLVTLPNSGNDLPNGFTNLGTQSLVEGEYTATVGYEWNYQNIHYGLVDDFTATINPAGEGNSRIDVIHTVPGTNEFAKTEGTVSAGQNTAVKPAIPVGALEVTILSIYEDSISEPTDPITGEQFITKSSYGWTQSNISGENTTIIYQSDANAFELINASLISIDSVAVSIEDSYNGQQVWILNKTGNSITLNNNASGGLATFLPFIFPLGQDMTISNNGLVRFKRKDNEMLFESYSIMGSQGINEVLGVDNVATLPLIMKNSSIFFQNSAGQQIAVLKNNASSSLLLDLINLGLNVPFVLNGKVSLGTSNTTTGAFSAGIGQNNSSSAPASVTIGHNNIAVNYGEVVVGNLSNQDSTGQRTFGVGVGNLSGGTNRKDGLNVFLTGEVTAPELTTALINSGTARILTTKEWVNAGLALKANDADVLHKTGNEVKNGSLTVNSLLMVTPQMRIGNDSGYLQWIGLTNDLSDRRFTFESDPGVSGGKNFFIYAGGQLVQTWLESKTSFAKPVELGKYTNGTEPILIVGAVYFNTTKDRLMIGRSDGWLAIDELKSPNGSKFKLNVSDTGVLTTTSA